MQTTHAFALGDRVDLAKAPHNTPRGPYEITALMPEGRDGEPQYGLRGPEGRERVVTETEILALREPAAEPKMPTPEEARAQREADKAERQADAKSAWNDYLDERDALLRRTAELREMRLRAEAEAAEKILKIAREAASAKTLKVGPPAKAEAAKKPKAKAQPKTKAATVPAAKSAAKPKARTMAKATKKPATRTSRPKAGSAKAKPAEAARG